MLRLKGLLWSCPTDVSIAAIRVTDGRVVSCVVSPDGPTVRAAALSADDFISLVSSQESCGDAASGRQWEPQR